MLVHGTVILICEMGLVKARWKGLKTGLLLGDADWNVVQFGSGQGADLIQLDLFRN